MPYDRARAFTLVELVVVMMIIGLTTALAVSAFRGESPSAKLDRAALEFETFCARVRYQAMERGADRRIVYDDADKEFRMSFPEPDDDASDAELTAASSFEPPPSLRWKIPDGFEFTEEEAPIQPGPDGTTEVFRFFPDGSAEGTLVFRLRSGKFARSFSVSTLTGLIRNQEESQP